MAAANLNILIEQGATFSRVLTIKDESGSAIDLTGFSFAGQVRRRYSDSTVLGSFTFTILNQTTNKGQVSMVMSSTVTAAIPVDKSTDYTRKITYCTYDVEMNTGSEKDRILEGTAEISPEVTR